jgi:hypothetical protein
MDKEEMRGGHKESRKGGQKDRRNEESEAFIGQEDRRRWGRKRLEVGQED